MGAETIDGEQAVGAATTGNYAAIILDVMMPRLSGTEALRLIRQVSDVPIIMLTAKGDDVVWKASRSLSRIAGSSIRTSANERPVSLALSA